MHKLLISKILWIFTGNLMSAFVFSNGFKTDNWDEARRIDIDI